MTIPNLFRAHDAAAQQAPGRRIEHELEVHEVAGANLNGREIGPRPGVLRAPDDTVQGGGNEQRGKAFAPQGVGAEANQHLAPIGGAEDLE